MRQILKVLLVVFVCGLVGLFVIRLTWAGFGLGHFDQVVVLEGNLAPEKVLCCACDVDAGLRKLAEERADHQMFAYDEAERISDSRYHAPIKYTFRDGLLHGTTVYYPQQLVLLIELSDGKKVCRVVDLPRSQGRDPVVVNVR